MNSSKTISWVSKHSSEATPILRRVLLFGGLTNVLALAPSFYMLEVYGRVVNSRSHMTLIMLTILIVAAYLWLEVLEWVRSDLLLRMSGKLDSIFAPKVFDAIFQNHLHRIPSSEAPSMQDVAVLRNFMASRALVAVLDAPYALMVMIILFFIHPTFGLAAVVVACLMMGVGWLTARSTRTPMLEARLKSKEAQNFAAAALRQSDVMVAMGMYQDVYALWKEKQDAFLIAQAIASDHAGFGAATSKFIQQLQGSLMLGLGCWHTINGNLDSSGGMMFMASLLGGRALAPITQVIVQWPQVAQARQALASLEKHLGLAMTEQQAMSLPAPTGSLAVQGLTVLAPGTKNILLRGIQFNLNPGEMLAVLGPSGVGKTCLCRALVGVWPAATGKVRLDGVDVFTWNKTELGPFVGYLPQDTELFDGSLAENITRFGKPPDLAQLHAAALAVGLDRYIASLPLGFDTPVGLDGGQLSGGVRQRVGLARAIYGNPTLVVLDEPNASLDEAGDQALLQAISQTKQRGASVVLVTHRPEILALADKLLVLREGQMQAFGPRDQVMEALKQAIAKARAAVGGV